MKNERRKGEEGKQTRRRRRREGRGKLTEEAEHGGVKEQSESDRHLKSRGTTTL